jgi:hypothetical protein
MKSKILKAVEENTTSTRYTKLIENRDFKDYLSSKFPQYDVEKDTSLMVALLKMNLNEKPKCAHPSCEKLVSYTNRKFPKYCDQICRRDHEKETGLMAEILKKGQATYKERTGFDHQWSNPDVQNKVKKTMIERYGVDSALKCEEIKEKVMETNIARYGVAHGFQSEEIKQKTKETIIERYGVDHIAKSEIIKKKIRKTNSERYGVEVSSQNNTVKEKQCKTNLERFGSDYFFSSKQFTKPAKEKAFNDLIQKYEDECTPLFSIDDYTGLDNSFMEWRCHKCGKVFKCRLRSQKNIKCTHCYPKENNEEMKIRRFLEDRNIDFEFSNTSILNPQHLDFHLPDYNLAIEYCGLYWHSTIIRPNKDYHLNKLEKCLSKGIQLITIFGDEKWESVEIRLKQILGIDKIVLTDFKIMEINKYVADQFFVDYHTDIRTEPSSLRYGLFTNNELVTCMSLKKCKNKWIIQQYCSRYNIEKSFDTLLKHFIEQNNPNEIIYITDRKWEEGKHLTKFGFKLVETIEPEFLYYDRLINKYKRLYEEEINEAIDCARVYDCGSNKYQYKKPA